jgi:2,3-bisphosphoglycerate-independent phosphoglycerate mutase
MDGIGLRDSQFGNAVALAKTPCMHHLREDSKKTLFTTLKAHGRAVGLPTDDDIGNSEVGHNALGAGRIFDQGAKLVQNAINNGSLYKGKTWRALVDSVKKNNSTLHFLGLLSDGNVHANEQHLYSMMRAAKDEGINKVRLHILFDGRDVGERSAEIYVERLEKVIKELASPSFDVRVASGGGRMRITMDRYGADWEMVKRGWDTHVLGKVSDKSLEFPDLDSALATFRLDPKLTDQYLPAFVVSENGKPVGTINDGDGVILFNFRGDRAIEISRAFTESDFSEFSRERFPKVFYAGMMQYDGDRQIPPRYLVSPPLIDNTLSEYLIKFHLRQFACSETQKYGHVTFFWNGNRSGYLNKDLEEYLEIKSDVGITFDEKPEMKALEITEATIDRMKKGAFDFGRINYANGDMVGHTGNLAAAIHAVDVVDAQLAKLIKAADETGTILLITADHGNADEMFEGKEKDFPNWRTATKDQLPRPKTAHTLAPVPLYMYDPKGFEKFQLATLESRSLANVASTVVMLLGLPKNPIFLPSLLEPTS